MSQACDILDINLADEGQKRILWADRDMPVLARIRERFAEERPLEGVRIGACMHVTTETANLMRTLVASGAEVTLCASNPLSTQDDTAASLVRDYGVRVYAIAGEDAETYERHIAEVVATNPQIIMDDGADLDTALHTKFPEKLEGVIGGTEETTTGVVRLMAMAKDGALRYPVFNINDANTKHCFDNHYGTGQSTLDGIVRATNRLLCGRTMVVSGYGYCGSGLAQRAKGMGMDVIVCEVDPLKALEAHMEGYRVMKAEDAARFADVWVTVTGDCNVIDEPAFKNMKDGAIICNSGHFDSEINMKWLRANAVKVEELKPLVEEYTLPDGRPYTYEGVSRKGPERYEAALGALGSTGAPDPDAVCIVPLLPDSSVLLEREFRYPLNSWCVSLPAGLIDAGESLEEAVARELSEETGYRLHDDIAPAVRPLPQPGFSSTGLTEENVQVVFAQVEAAGEARPDSAELIEPFTVARADLRAFLDANKLPIGTRCQLILELLAL